MNAATARSSSTIANTRCRLAAGSEKPAANSAGATVAPRPMPVSPEPISVSAWRRRQLDAEHRDAGGQEAHSGQRQVLQRPLVDHHAEQDRGEERAGELRQVQQPHVQRAVARGEQVRRQRRRRHDAAAANSARTMPGDGDRAREHGADRQQRSLGPVLVGDQDDDERQATGEQAEGRGSRGTCG